MRLGIGLPNSGPFADRAALLSLARRAEELGFDGVWLHDHVSWPQEKLTHFPAGSIEACSDQLPNFFESITTAAVVGGSTSQIRVGIGGLVLPFRDPRIVGKQLATLSELLGGRLTVAFGIGGTPAEFELMQVPWNQRGRITDEYLDVLTAMFQPEPLTSFSGSRVSFSHGTFFPKPASLPIWIAAHSEAGLKRVVRMASGWFTAYPSVADVRTQVQRLSELATDAGRSLGEFERAGIIFVCLAETRDQAFELSTPTLTQRFGSMERGLAACAVGTASDVLARVNEYEQAGATYLELRFIAHTVESMAEMMGIVGEEVRPHVTAAAPQSQ